MRRIWLSLGFALGALFVWALTAKKRHAGERWERFAKAEQQSMDAMRMDLAVEGAIDGVDYLDYLDRGKRIPPNVLNELYEDNDDAR